MSTNTSFLEILPHILKYVRKYQRPYLRFISKDFKRIIDRELWMILNVSPENWEFLHTKRNVIGVNFKDFTIPYYLQPLESTEYLRKISFCGLTLPPNVHCILRKCNHIRSLGFSKISLGSDLKYNPSNPIVLPNLQVLQIQTNESQLSKDEEVLMDFLSRITYLKLKNFYIWYSKAGDYLNELKLYYIWNIYTPAHPVSKLIFKNISTLELFSCGMLEAPDIFRFNQNTNQLSHLSVKSKYPLTLQGFFVRQSHLEYIELTQLPFELWFTVLTLVRNCAETLVYLKLSKLKNELRFHPNPLNLAMLTGIKNLRHLDIHLNLKHIYGISFLPETLQYLSLKGEMTKFDLYDIGTHLSNLDYLYLDLEEVEQSRNEIQYGPSGEELNNDLEYMTLTVDVPVLKELISMPKIGKLILKNCTGYYEVLKHWCENGYKDNERKIDAAVVALNDDFTLGNIDITVFNG